MNNIPRQTLRKIVAKYGNDLGGNARRCEGLLKDLCGEYRREINVLTSAVEERIPLDLLAAGSSMPRELLLTKLSRRLEDNLGLTPEAAQWAVDSWALALGVVSDAEIAAKEKKQSESATPDLPINPTRPIPPNPKTQNPGIQTPVQNRPPQNSPRLPPTQPNLQPKIYPPIARTPANFPTPAPPKQQSPQTGGSSSVNVPRNAPQANYPTTNAVVPKKRFRKFFGCLFVFFLLIVTGTVLFFGVPYAIEVMRETQPSEPPRFPPQ
jgi:hypothetical protein